MSPSSRNLLFVCGTPRSGTTGMQALLTGDERIALGMERYGAYLGNDFYEGLFTKERFFDFETDERDKNRKSSAEAVRHKFDDATFIGDKIPLMYLSHSRVSAVFPNAKHVVMLRNILDICNSYKTRKEDPEDDWELDVGQAVTHWNQLLDFIVSEAKDPNIHVVVYEDFLTDIIHYKNVYKFLGLEFDESCEIRYAAMLSKTKRLEDKRNLLLTDSEKLAIFKSANLGTYQNIILGKTEPSPTYSSEKPKEIIGKSDPKLNRQDVIAAARIFLGEQELADATIESLVGATGEEALNYFMKSQAFQDNDFNARLVVGMAKEIRTRVKTV